jgi:hypothetical protein
MFMIGRNVLYYIITTDRTDNDLNVLYLKQKTKFCLLKDIRGSAMCNVIKTTCFKSANCLTEGNMHSQVRTNIFDYPFFVFQTIKRALWINLATSIP